MAFNQSANYFVGAGIFHCGTQLEITCREYFWFLCVLMRIFACGGIVDHRSYDGKEYFFSLFS
jgi:hypothetical protein